MKRRDFLRTSALAGAALTLDFKGLSAALMNNTMAVEAVPDMVAVMGGEPAVMLDKALEALGVYDYLVAFAGAGATVPISGFGYLLARGAMRGAQRGLFGALTGALSAASAGITAAILFAFVFALIFRPKSKKN